MKKFSTLLTLSLLLPITTLATFTDIAKIPSWALDSTLSLQKEDIITGFGDGTFRPYKALNRAEAVALILRTKKIQTETLTSKVYFPDTKLTDWFIRPVTYAAEKGWIKGRKNGNFEASKRLNRAEFATMITRAFDLPIDQNKNEMKFKDIPSKAWFHNPVLAFYRNGLVRSPQSQRYHPEKVVTRAEAAWVFYKIINMPRLTGESKMNNFSSKTQRSSRKVSIRPRNFNKFKQGYDIEKKAVNLTAKKNGDLIVLTRDSEWTDVGSVALENTLEERVELDSLFLKLRFRRSGTGPADTFEMRLQIPDLEYEEIVKVARTGEIAFTKLPLNIKTDESIELFLSLRPQKNSRPYNKVGTATLTVVQARGLLGNYRFAPVEMQQILLPNIEFQPVKK